MESAKRFNSRGHYATFRGNAAEEIVKDYRKIRLTC